MDTNTNPTVATPAVAVTPTVAPVAPKTKGRKHGSVSNSIVDLAELVSKLAPSAGVSADMLAVLASVKVPVAKKFTDNRGLIGTPAYASAAYAAVIAPVSAVPTPAPVASAPQPSVQIATVDFDAQGQ